MSSRILPILVSLTLGSLLAFAAFGPGSEQPSASPASSAAAETFEIDVAHSTVTYRIRHFNVSWFHGRIQKPRGEFLIDPDDLGSSFINVTLEIKNMDAGNQSRDQFLKSPDFFNVKEYPTATFVSKAIRKTGTDTYEVDGEFTMHGVTKRITAPLVDYSEAATTRFGYRAGFECTFTVKRSEYGMDLFVEEGTLGDDTRITVSLEGVRRGDG